MTGIKSPRCARGHKMSGENVYIRPDGSGRSCKKCRKVYEANRQQKKKQKSS